MCVICLVCCFFETGNESGNDSKESAPPMAIIRRVRGSTILWARARLAPYRNIQITKSKCVFYCTCTYRFISSSDYNYNLLKLPLYYLCSSSVNLRCMLIVDDRISRFMLGNAAYVAGEILLFGGTARLLHFRLGKHIGHGAQI